MDHNTRGLFFWFLFSSVGLIVGDTSGLTIYRFGGETFPLPREVGHRGVNFIQLSWSDWDASSGGKVFELDMDDQAIWPIQHDPQENMIPQIKRKLEAEEGVDYGATGQALDGNLNTAWIVDTYLCAEYSTKVRSILCDEDGFGQIGSINLDLGGLFLIEKVRLVSGLVNQHSIVENFRISLFPTIFFYEDSSRGGQTTLRIPPWALPFTIDVQNNTQPFREVKVPSDYQKAIALRVAVGEHHIFPWEVTEIEVYAKGVVDTATYESNIIDIGKSAVWGEIRWSGHKAPGTQIFLQTRSGLDGDPTLYWRFTGRGGDKEQVSRSQYAKLKVGEKAGTSYDRNSWTFWSGPYDFADSSGASVISLNPRRFFQFKVDFVSNNGEPGSRLNYFELLVSSPPVASKLVGEIYPTQVDVGKSTRFIYALKPTIRGDDTGFDRLEMTTPALITAIHSVRIGEGEVPFTLETLDDNRFEVRFPKVDKSTTGTLVEVIFDAQILRHQSSFHGRVSDSSRPLEAPQLVRVGDATGEFEGNTITVATSVDPQLILGVEVSPGIFTPNGDGVNDQVNIMYVVFETTTFSPVTIEIKDLAGHLVRKVYSGEDWIGYHNRVWDGRNNAGARVPPGIYVYRVSIDTATGQIHKMGTIDVVY